MPSAYKLPDILAMRSHIVVTTALFHEAAVPLSSHPLSVRTPRQKLTNAQRVHIAIGSTENREASDNIMQNGAVCTGVITGRVCATSEGTSGCQCAISQGHMANQIRTVPHSSGHGVTKAIQSSVLLETWTSQKGEEKAWEGKPKKEQTKLSRAIVIGQFEPQSHTQLNIGNQHAAAAQA